MVVASWGLRPVANKNDSWKDLSDVDEDGSADKPVKRKPAASPSSKAAAAKATAELKRPAAAPPSKAAAATAPASAAKKTAAAAAAAAPAKKTIGKEGTRSQMRCRRPDGTSFAIPWGYRGGEWVRSEAEAVAEAKAWLKRAD